MSYPVSYNKDSPFLQHYGVKGMKWGIRKERKNSPKQRKKKLSDMSDEELQARIDRLRKETEYKRLNSELVKGRPSSKIRSILVTSGTAVATVYTQKYMKAGLDALIRFGYAQAMSDKSNKNIKWVL